VRGTKDIRQVNGEQGGEHFELDSQKEKLPPKSLHKVSIKRSSDFFVDRPM
jgi:hypothetical protein